MTAFNFITILIRLLFDITDQTSYSFMLMFYNLFYLIIVLSYTYNLRQDKCKCAEGMDASVIYYARAIDFMLLILILTAVGTNIIVLRSKK
jgi:hypothetical protein